MYTSVSASFSGVNVCLVFLDFIISSLLFFTQYTHTRYTIHMQYIHILHRSRPMVTSSGNRWNINIKKNKKNGCWVVYSIHNKHMMRTWYEYAFWKRWFLSFFMFRRIILPYVLHVRLGMHRFDFLLKKKIILIRENSFFNASSYIMNTNRMRND